ncbi:E3 ubiquitin-protein ligase UPL5-like [Apium graveolens]|uniref:E3 ubiquitin-protein ligase UPL5-like n=1 Tax=Apium graveolens TaxID=4045 RepID=UPI003D79FC6B
MKKGDRFLYVFVGKIIALAMMHNVQLGITFDRLLYLGLAGKDIGIEDFKETDPKLYLSWKNCLDKEDDETVLCVEESIDEFLDSIYEKIEGIKSGFKSASLFVFPESANFFRDIGARGVDNFLLGDTADISVQDWMNHTDYVGYTKDDPQISWFWKVVKNLSQEEMRDLLFFWTAVKFLPPGGFKGLPMRLCISRTGGEEWRWPLAFTCFFRLNIPSYASSQVLQERMQCIIGGNFCFDLE